MIWKELETIKKSAMAVHKKSSNSHGFFSYIPQRSSEKYQKNCKYSIEREKNGRQKITPLFDVIITIKKNVKKIVVVLVKVGEGWNTCVLAMLWLLKKRIFYGHDMKLPFQMQSFEWVKNLRLYKFCGPITQHLYTNTNKDITLELYLLESNMVHCGLQTIHYIVEIGLADFWKPMKQIWP